MLAAGSDNDYLQRLIGSQTVQCGGYLRNHILGKRIKRFWGIHRYQTDLALGIDQNVFIFHRNTSPWT